jgi:hypothetical protein
MMKSKWFLMVVFLLVIAACNTNRFYDKSAYPSMPAEYKYWKKEGATETDVKKAMLECGKMPSGVPGPAGSGTEGLGFLTPDDYLQFTLCMRSSGFIYGLGTEDTHSDWNTWCANPFIKSPPEMCRRSNIVPRERSVERRLNSNYCQNSSGRAECQP